MAGSTRRRTRQRGHIEELRNGALRVKVYAGQDPISKRQLYLTETVPQALGLRSKPSGSAPVSSTRLTRSVTREHLPRSTSSSTSTSTSSTSSPAPGADTRASSANTSDHYSDRSRSAESAPRSSTRSTPSYGAAATTATGDRSCSIGPRRSTTAILIPRRHAHRRTRPVATASGCASPTSAGRSASPRSGRSTGSSAARLNAPSRGTGSRSIRRTVSSTPSGRRTSRSRRRDAAASQPRRRVEGRHRLHRGERAALALPAEGTRLVDAATGVSDEAPGRPHANTSTTSSWPH